MIKFKNIKFGGKFKCYDWDNAPEWTKVRYREMSFRKYNAFFVDKEGDLIFGYFDQKQEVYKVKEEPKKATIIKKEPVQLQWDWKVDKNSGIYP